MEDFNVAEGLAAYYIADAGEKLTIAGDFAEKAENTELEKDLMKLSEQTMLLLRKYWPDMINDITKDENIDLDKIAAQINTPEITEN